MRSDKIKYFAQVTLMLIVFSIVLSGLIFQFIGEMKSEAIKKKAEQTEEERLKTEFMDTIEDRYKAVKKLYQTREYEKVMEAIKLFSTYDKSDYKDLQKIKKESQISYLKKKLDFIPKIDFDKYIKSLQDEEKEKDTSTQVFIRRPRYGKYFFSPSDLPIVLEGIALSLSGDFSNEILWTSSINGELGKGNQLSVRLSIGEHKITATATNGITTGMMETLIYIKADQ